jgi:AcrR family transcriptional regulator
MVTVKTDKRLEARPGGTGVLQKDVTEAITKAALAEVAKHGFGLLSMEAVARRAKVGKAALYRRWPSRDAMIQWLLGVSGLEYASAADTGSLAGDLLSFFQNAVSVLENPKIAPILPHLYAEMATKSHIAVLIRETVQPAKRERADEILDRAIARDELSPQINRDMAIDLMSGPLYWRLIVLGNQIEPGYIERLAHAVLASLIAVDQGGRDRVKPVAAIRATRR